MSVLTASRVIDRKGARPVRTTLLAKANAKGFKGGIVATDATGYAVSGASLQATGLKVWGVAIKDWDNTGGASGALQIDVEGGPGTYWPFVNLGGDPIVQATQGVTVFVEDDQTVRLTSNTSTRSNAGTFKGFDETGVPLVELGNFSVTGV